MSGYDPGPAHGPTGEGASHLGPEHSTQPQPNCPQSCKSRKRLVHQQGAIPPSFRSDSTLILCASAPRANRDVPCGGCKLPEATFHGKTRRPGPRLLRPDRGTPGLPTQVGNLTLTSPPSTHPLPDPEVKQSGESQPGAQPCLALSLWAGEPQPLFPHP